MNNTSKFLLLIQVILYFYLEKHNDNEIITYIYIALFQMHFIFRDLIDGNINMKYLLYSFITGSIVLRLISKYGNELVLKYENINNDLVKEKYDKYNRKSRFIVYYILIPGVTYLSLKYLPENLRWTFERPSINKAIIQFLIMFVLHDLLFWLVHKTVHVVPNLRKSHWELHHGCNLNKYNTKCTLSGTPYESLFRDFLSSYIPTLVVGNLYAPYFIIFYGVYTIWSLHSHSGKNLYHSIHHAKNYKGKNYGLYYFADALLDTLSLRKKDLY